MGEEVVVMVMLEEKSYVEGWLCRAGLEHDRAANAGRHGRPSTGRDLLWNRRMNKPQEKRIGRFYGGLRGGERPRTPRCKSADGCRCSRRPGKMETGFSVLRDVGWQRWELDSRRRYYGEEQKRRIG